MREEKSTRPGSEVLVAEDLAGAATQFHGRAGVQKASLRVRRGELVAVLGRSGSGKSALLALCGGFDRPERGRVSVDGLELADLDPADRPSFLQTRVGWVFQEPGLVPVLTAVENVAIAMRIAGEDEEEATRRSRAALEAVGLGERAGHPATDLSRGEQQRVALARAWVKTPALLIADEPAAQLDSGTGRQILELLARAARSDVAVLFSTHDEEEAAQADRVLVMEDGVLQEAV